MEEEKDKITAPSKAKSKVRLRNIPILKRILDIGYAMVLIVVLSAIVGFIFAFPVMWLWNYVFMNIPILKINVFQAWALNILTGILFGKTTESKK